MYRCYYTRMEKKIVVIKDNSKLYEIKENSIFLWKLESEEVINEYKTRLTFVRDNEVPYYAKLVELEKRFFKVSPIPMWSIITLGVLALGFFTAFLILFIIKQKNLDMFMAFLTTILPALVFTLGVGLLGLFRTKHSLHYIQTSTQRFEEYQKEVEKLFQKEEKVD